MKGLARLVATSATRLMSTASLVLLASTMSATMSATTAHAQALPTAAEIIAKHVAAIGGKDAVLAIKSMSQTGTLEIPAMGLSASMEMMIAAPNKMTSKTNVPGMGEMLQGYNGAVAWDVNPMAGPRVLADKELDQIKEQSDFYANLLYSADRYSKMDVQSVVDYAGEKAYKVLTVRKTSGTESTMYFSVATGLFIGGESTQMSQMGPMQVSQNVSGYKAFGALKFPTKIEQTIGPNKMVLTMTNVSFNSVPDAAFDVPAQVKPLVKP